MLNVPKPLASLALAHATSLSGTVILTVAVPWLVLTTTGSATLAATAVFAGVGGAALGGLAAGRVVDAIGPVRTAAGAELANALAVAPLAVLLAFDVLEIWHVLLLGFLGTLVDSAASTARQALVPATADAHGFPRARANALFTSAEHIGYLLGAPLAGVLIAWFGIGMAIWVIVAAFSAAGLLVLRLHAGPAHPAPDTAPSRGSLREVFAYIWHEPVLRVLFVFPTVAVMLVAPLVPLVLPVLAREVFGTPVVLGLMVASYGVGGLVGAAGFGIFGGSASRRRLFVGVFSLIPVTLAGIALSPAPALTMALLLTMGAGVGSLVPLMATIRQERSPAHLLARVVGLSTASIPVTGPVGVLASGVLIDVIGLRGTLLAMSGLALAIAVATALNRAVRSFDATSTTLTPVIPPLEEPLPPLAA